MSFGAITVLIGKKKSTCERNDHARTTKSLAIKCILGSFWTGLYMAKFDLDLQGHLGKKRSKLTKNGIFQALTFEGL